MSKYISELTLEAAQEVASNLLSDDRQEIQEGYGYDLSELPLEALSWGSCVSFVVPNGETAGMAGVMPDNKVWMLCTPAIHTSPFTFCAEAKRFIESREEPYLWNYVDKRNKTHIRLLKFLGFSFLREVPFGPNNLPFIEFIRLNVRSHLSRSRDC